MKKMIQSTISNRPLSARALLRVLLPAVIAAIVVGNTATACPSCNESVGTSAAGLAEGLSYGVIGMMSLPFLLFASIGGVVFRAYRLRNRRHEEMARFHDIGMN